MPVHTPPPPSEPTSADDATQMSHPAKPAEAGEGRASPGTGPPPYSALGMYAY